MRSKMISKNEFYYINLLFFKHLLKYRMHFYFYDLNALQRIAVSVVYYQYIISSTKHDLLCLIFL